MKFLIPLFISLLPLNLESTCTNRYTKNEIGLPDVAQWKKAPIVQVCPNSPVTKDEVQLILDEWADHGAPKLKAVSSKCNIREPRAGFVQIDNWRPEWLQIKFDGAHAVTITWPRDVLESAIIMVPDGDLGILRHEIGHLWFQGHTEKHGHVLCPFTNCIGDGWEGIKRAFRKRRHKIISLNKAPAGDLLEGVAYPLPESALYLLDPHTCGLGKKFNR